MEIDTVYQIAKREWDNISISLAECGNMGSLEFDKMIAQYPLLITNLYEMEIKINYHDYKTLEAGFVFRELTTFAAYKLGLANNLALTFGSGYSWVRTGMCNLYDCKIEDMQDFDEHLRKQIMFYKLFFPFQENLNWKFESSFINQRLKHIFDKFIGWQSEPGKFANDLFIYRSGVDNLIKGIHDTLGNPVGNC